VVDRILQTYQLMRKSDADRVEASRERISRYIEKLDGMPQALRADRFFIR
jgi:hypothetical protein